MLDKTEKDLLEKGWSRYTGQWSKWLACGVIGRRVEDWELEGLPFLITHLGRNHLDARSFEYKKDYR